MQVSDDGLTWTPVDLDCALPGACVTDPSGNVSQSVQFNALFAPAGHFVRQRRRPSDTPPARLPDGRGSSHDRRTKGARARRPGKWRARAEGMRSGSVPVTEDAAWHATCTSDRRDFAEATGDPPEDPEDNTYGSRSFTYELGGQVGTGVVTNNQLYAILVVADDAFRDSMIRLILMHAEAH